MILLACYFFLAPPLLMADWSERSEVRQVQDTLDRAERAVEKVYAMRIGQMRDADAVFHKILYVRQWARHLEALPIGQMTAKQVMRRDELALKLWAREDQFSARFLELEDINRSETRKAA